MIRLLQGDCRGVLKTLPDNSVQCCVTSPPYYGLRDYGVDCQIGLEQTPDEYVAQLVEVFREVRRVLRDDGTLWLNLGDSYFSPIATQGRNESKSAITTLTNHGASGRSVALDVKKPTTFRRDGNGLKAKDLMGIPWRVAFALQDDGWWLRSDIIWAKRNCMPESVRDRPTRAHEYLFLLTKSERYYYDAEAIAEPLDRPEESERKTPARFGGAQKHLESRHQSRLHSGNEYRGTSTGTRNKRSVWWVATQAFPEAHFATFPPDLIGPCILAGTSERGCCSSCGAPWVRVITKGEPDWQHRASCGADSSGGYNGQSTKGHDAAGVQNASDVKRRILEGLRLKTSGWFPSCECDAPTVPCVVLDPFGGAGTTGLVADRLGRNATLIELNAAYVAMARNRIADDAGMLAMLAAE